MPKEVTPRWSRLGKFPPGTCKLCLVTLLANRSDSQRTRPYRSKSLQFQCCRRTRNWGCQLPFETFSTRTSTRSSRPRFPSPMAQILSRPGAPPALDLFPFCGVCVSFRRVLIESDTAVGVLVVPEAEQIRRRFWQLRKPAFLCLSTVAGL